MKRAWRRLLGRGGGLSLSLLLSIGCSSEERPRAVPPPTPPAKATKDYRALLQESRQRQRLNNGLDEVRTALQRFQTELGRTPTNLLELVRARYLPALPPPPPGTTYYLEPTYGQVRLIQAAPPPAASPTGRPGVRLAVPAAAESPPLQLNPPR